MLRSWASGDGRSALIQPMSGRRAANSTECGTRDEWFFLDVSDLPCTVRRTSPGLDRLPAAFQTAGQAAGLQRLSNAPLQQLVDGRTPQLPRELEDSCRLWQSMERGCHNSPAAPRLWAASKLPRRAAMAAAAAAAAAAAVPSCSGSGSKGRGRSGGWRCRHLRRITPLHAALHTCSSSLSPNTHQLCGWGTSDRAAVETGARSSPNAPRKLLCSHRPQPDSKKICRYWRSKRYATIPVVKKFETAAVAGARGSSSYHT